VAERERRKLAATQTAAEQYAQNGLVTHPL
jgi:hypothetical protein